ncbi:Rho termination factor N-terminal domain-containing protein [Bacillus rhizoplanae]|uniref:Rho termination factor N-terminal domain-containing protein n=1 Tax=Bacillus rhizoplanae TaxID=2880966 RepID=UPI003D22008A
MIVEIRKTVSGTEYWDAKEKRSLLVPAGEEPGFEVTENPKSMVKFADDKVVDVKVEEPVQLKDMTVKELHEYANELGIDIPTDVKKKEDIIKLLS